MHSYTTYKDWGGDSSVKSYLFGEDFICIEFKSGHERFYQYTNSSAGSNAIYEMKRLASANEGLGSYISKYDPGFAAKSKFPI